MKARGSIRLAALVLASLLAGCSSPEPAFSSNSTTSLPPTTSPALAPPTTGTSPTVSVPEEYLPGLEANVFLPVDGTAPIPLVVMIPGGAWRTADPFGFAGLARHLADAGIMAVTVSVRAAVDGVVYPTPVEDVLCAVGFAADTAEANRIELGSIVLLGHSSGAHLAALAALAPEDYASDCAGATTRASALVAIAGPYDVTQDAVAESLFGVAYSADPDLWDSGNALLKAGLRPDLPVLLIHGEDDTIVPSSFTTEFGAALEEAGHRTTLIILPGANHDDIYSAGVSGDLIVDWVADLGP
ncbi:MAG TPA: alpha/beta hydrolase [Acidimicrobiia bacterium]|nr:alpha/beta hydrolase [Acidimicrobiia bacterium]